MKKDIVDNYFKNVNWFNDFFDGIYQILNTIKDDLSQEYNLSDKETFIYYPKNNTKPGIPSYNALFLKLQYSLQVFAILNNNLLSKNNYFQNEPSLFFLVHKDNNNWGSDWRGLPVIKNEGVEYGKKFSSIHTGKFRDKKPLPEEIEDFYCFQILLDSFKDKDSIKKVIHNVILKNINLIFEKL